MAILVTGSSGFIARYLIPEFIAMGSSVIGIDKRPQSVEFGENFRHVLGNILDRAAVDAVMSDVEVVVHLAAEHADFGIAESLYHDVNVLGTQQILESAARYGVPDIVFFSSVAVYGETAVPSHEGLAPGPSSPYGASKLGAEGLIERWVRESADRRALVLRPAVIHGPHNYANMFRLISQIAHGKYVHIGRGDNTKSVGYVENLMNATVFLMERMEAGCEVYNFADQPHLTSREIAMTIAESLGASIPSIAIPKWVAVPLALPFDAVAAISGRNVPITSARIRKYGATTHHSAEKLAKTGFVPIYTSTQGIQQTTEWYASSESARE